MTKITYTGPAVLWRTAAYGGLTVERGDTVDVDEEAAKHIVSTHDFVMGDGEDESTFEFDDADTATTEEPSDEDGNLDDFDAIDGVGASTEENLYDAGITTFDDVATATDDELLGIDGVGQSALDALRSHIGSNDTGDSAFDIGGE